MQQIKKPGIKLDVPYVPTSQEKLEIMLEFANVQHGQKAVDLGSGDGRVVIGLAKLGAVAHGYEIEPSRVMLSRLNIEKEGLGDRASIYEKSYWDVDFSDFDIVTIYGITSIMPRLEAKLMKELKPGAKVVSNSFTFPNWPHVEKRNNVYLYIKP